jgi:F0F1-type ATP synthase membrane subunit b/b'
MVSFWLGGTDVVPFVLAEDQVDKSPGILERIGKTAQKVGDKIEQGFTKAGRKLKEKKVGEKIEQKLNKAAHKTAEGLKKAGDKINQKLND